MAITLPPSVATAATATPAQSLVIGKPAGLATGDLLTLMVARAADDNTSVTVTWSCPGFTVLAGVSPGAASARGATVLYKFVTDAGTEPADYTVTATPSNGAVQLNLAGGAAAWTGVDPATPFDVAAASQSATSQSVTAPSLTTVTENAVLLFFGRARRAVTFTPDASMTEAFDVAASGGDVTNLIAAELAYQQLGAPGATGTRTSVISGGINRENTGVALALRPAVAGLDCRVYLAGAWTTGTVRRIA